VFTWS
jgi:hypothetical protein